jgi:hypothetical protein
VGQTAPQPKPSTLFCPKPPTRADSGPAVAKARKTASTANYLAATCTAAARLSTARPPETVHVSQHQQREHVEPQVTGSQHLGSSRKLHLRPTHYDAQTAGARFTRIPRSMKRRNPRSKAQPGVHCGAAFGIRTRDLRITSACKILMDGADRAGPVLFSLVNELNEDLGVLHGPTDADGSAHATLTRGAARGEPQRAAILCSRLRFLWSDHRSHQRRCSASQVSSRGSQITRDALLPRRPGVTGLDRYMVLTQEETHPPWGISRHGRGSRVTAKPADLKTLFDLDEVRSNSLKDQAQATR